MHKNFFFNFWATNDDQVNNEHTVWKFLKKSDFLASYVYIFGRNNKKARFARNVAKWDILWDFQTTVGLKKII